MTTDLVVPTTDTRVPDPRGMTCRAWSATAQHFAVSRTSALREARDQIVALKEEIDRLAQPPSGFGVFLADAGEGNADIFTGGRKMRVSVSPSIEPESLRPGQEVMLNEALNIVAAFGFEKA